jgi:hypothetical protein
MFRKHLLVYINSIVPFHENLSLLPSHRSGVPGTKITACESFCSLKFHIVCICIFFGDTICLPTNRKMVKIATLIDSHNYCVSDIIIICLLTLLFSLQYFSESWIGNDNNFLLPNLWDVLFFIYPCNLLLTHNFVYPTLFSSVPPPAIIREFEQENEVGRRRRGWQFLPVLHIMLRILSLGSGMKTDYRDSCLAVCECWLKSLPWSG